MAGKREFIDRFIAPNTIVRGPTPISRMSVRRKAHRSKLAHYASSTSVYPLFMFFSGKECDANGAGDYENGM